ncbi:MAG: lysylphosphatidylglycerol synthase transmembrane domain-containing protein [Bryobacteraceae bacterium]
MLAGVGGLLLFWALRRQLANQSFDWKLAGASLAGLRWNWLALSLLPIAGTYIGRALRWRIFLKPLKSKPSFRNLLSATVIGFTAITLFGRPGEFVRPYLIAIKEQVSVSSQISAWILERAFDLLMAILVFGLALARLNSAGLRLDSRLAWVLQAGGRMATFSGFAVLILLLSMRHLAEPIRRRLASALAFLPDKYHQRVDGMLTGLVQGVESTRSDYALFLVLLYSVAEWALIVISYWCLAQSFGAVLHLTFEKVLIFAGFVSFGAVIQLPGIGGGAQVIAVVVLTELFGVKLEVATSFAMFMWAITFLVVVPVGLVTAVRAGFTWRSLRRLGREPL